MPLVLKSDPEGTIIVSEIEYDGHIFHMKYRPVQLSYLGGVTITCLPMQLPDEVSSLI